MPVSLLSFFPDFSGSQETAKDQVEKKPEVC